MIAANNKTTIHSHFVLPLLSSAAARGYPPSQFLNPAGMSPDIMAQPRVRFTAEQFNTIVKNIWKTLNDENAGLGPRPVPMGLFELLCEVSMAAPDIEGFFRQLMKYLPVVSESHKFIFQVQQGRCNFGFNYTDFDDKEHIDTEWTLFAWHRFSCWLAGEPIPLLQASFNYSKPEYADEYRHLFGCPCYFDGPRAEIQFDARFLSLPILKRKTDLKDFIHRSPGVLLATPASEASFAAKVRKILLSNNDDTLSFPSFEGLAKSFDLSVQTLRRRLREEGTSYQGIKDDIRRDISIDLLAHQSLPIYEIGRRVGFNEASGFSRAFRDWTGVSPSAYRNGLTEI